MDDKINSGSNSTSPRRKFRFEDITWRWKVAIIGICIGWLAAFNQAAEHREGPTKERAKAVLNSVPDKVKNVIEPKDTRSTLVENANNK